MSANMAQEYFDTRSWQHGEANVKRKWTVGPTWPRCSIYQPLVVVVGRFAFLMKSKIISKVCTPCLVQRAA